MRKGDWMQTYSGRQFWPLDPKPEEICIEDIASALSKICRFGGHCKFHYSVAQHSVYVCEQVPPRFRLTALLHDATEAYCCDVVRPLKSQLAGYQDIEDRIWLAIAKRFDLPRNIPGIVKDADDAVLLAEKDQVMEEGPEWSIFGVTPALIEISPVGCEFARDMFLNHFFAVCPEDLI